MKRIWGFPSELRWYRICLQCRRPAFDTWVGKIPWRRAWQPTPVFLPGESPGHRSLVGCRLWGYTESDMTEVTWQQHQQQGFPGGSDIRQSACNVGNPGSISGWRRAPGEGNGYPLQYSCLENSMDRGAWLATVNGVTKSHL